MRTLLTRLLCLTAVFAMAAAIGAPWAAATGEVEFKGKIARSYEESEEWWAENVRPDIVSFKKVKEVF